MSEELIDTTVELEVSAVADRLRDLADQLEAGGDLTVAIADESVTIAGPTGSMEYELEVEESPDEYELEIELEWPAARVAADTLEIDDVTEE